MKSEFELLGRRGFFGVLKKTAVLGLAGAMAAKARAEDPGNPYAYDLSRFQKTDPKLITFKEVARWPCPHKESRRIAMASDDQVYICAGHFINALNRAGEARLELELGGPACAVAVTKDGTIYAALRDHIEIFDSKGGKVGIWKSPSNKAWFSGLAAQSNTVFAADSGRRLIVRYDTAGKVTGEIGLRDSARKIPGLVVPSPFLDVMIHPDGLLRVNNPGRHCVETYSFDGELKSSWGKPTAAIEGFCGCCNPIAITSLPDGRMVTCEKGIPRVKVYTAAGDFESVVAGAESFKENAHACTDLNDCVHGGLDAAVDSTGRIYVLDIVTNDVRVMKQKA